MKKAVLHEDDRSRRNGDVCACVNGHSNIGGSLSHRIRRNQRSSRYVWPELAAKLVSSVFLGKLVREQVKGPTYQSRGVVHAVADHKHNLAGSLQL
jgi:hypothetical protein